MQALIDLASSMSYSSPREELRSPPFMPPMPTPPGSASSDVLYPPQMAPEELSGFGLNKDTTVDSKEDSEAPAKPTESPPESGDGGAESSSKMTQRMLMERLIAAGGLRGAEGPHHQQPDGELSQGENGISVDH